MYRIDRLAVAALVGLLLLATPLIAETRRVDGQTETGALYALFVPADWNGDLVLYAHGFIDPAAPIALPTNDRWEPLRDRLLDEGFAVAYSSFSENGLAVKDGAQQTHQLRGLFADEFGQPDRTYIIGHSLGGLIGVMLAETHPQHYAGAMPMCGMIAGSQAEIDYVANVRVVWDFFYPGVLPGDALDIPESYDLINDVINPVIGAILADPAGAGAIAAVQQTPVPWSNPAELVESLVRALGFNFRGFEDVLNRTHGNSPFDNWTLTYTGVLPEAVLAALNQQADRFTSTPDAENYLDHWYQPSGELGVPMLTLHNDLDPVVPLFHELGYQQIAAQAGAGSWLVQRTIDRYGHCEFEVEEMTQAFLDLVGWVESGVRPTP